MPSGERHRIDKISKTDSQTQKQTTDYSRRMYQIDQKALQVNRDADGHDYSKQDDSTSDPHVHPFHKGAINSAFDIPSSSGSSNHRNITAPDTGVLKAYSIQNFPENPQKAFGLRGGTKEYAEDYLNHLDTYTPGASPGDAKKEMNRFRQKYAQYTRQQSNGVFRDAQHRIPYQKAADEEPLGYTIHKEHRRRQNLTWEREEAERQGR